MRKTAPSRVPPWRPSSPLRWEGTARIASAKWCRGRQSSVVRAGVPGLRSLTTAAVALIAAIGSGCGSKGAVSLSARVEAIELTVSEGPFGASLDGSFDLVLDLGEAAPGATTVTLGSFGVRSAAGSVVDTLSLEAKPSFPLELSPGDSVRVELGIAEPPLLDEAEAMLVCSGDVWISGSVSDTSNADRPTPVASGRFSATCP